MHRPSRKPGVRREKEVRHAAVVSFRDFAVIVVHPVQPQAFAFGSKRLVTRSGKPIEFIAIIREARGSGGNDGKPFIVVGHIEQWLIITKGFPDISGLLHQF